MMTRWYPAHKDQVTPRRIVRLANGALNARRHSIKAQVDTEDLEWYLLVGNNHAH
jgi:hypothetical protein